MLYTLYVSYYVVVKIMTGDKDLQTLRRQNEHRFVFSILVINMFFFLFRSSFYFIIISKCKCWLSVEKL